MYQALYRKYRPRTFDEVCGHEHITSVLRTQIREGKASHAYLFCGSRGTGKTSCAKIMAKAVNCLDPKDGNPCNKCEACRGIDDGSVIDVVEMDAASNNGVDNIRSLCEDVKFLPTQVKKRVYIIDEVHMLSVGAFNALLKTLEEPPEHVLFILATTDVNKVPATIVSRCQRFDFRRIKSSVITDRLMAVAGAERLDLTRDAASIIAGICDGGMRDALSLLEACTVIKGEIGPEEVTRILGLSDKELMIDLVEACAFENPARALYLVGELYSKSGDFKEVIADFLRLYRDLTVLKFIPTPGSFLELYQDRSERLEKICERMTKDTLNYHIDTLEKLYVDYDRITSGKKAVIEMTFVKLCSPSLNDSLSSLSARIAKLEKQLKNPDLIRSAVSETVSEDETENYVKTAPPEPEKIISVEKSLESGETYDNAERLLISMQDEGMIKPYLSQVSFIKRGTTLYLVTSSFTKGILETVDAAQAVKTHLFDLDPDIKNVVIALKEDVPKADVKDDLDDL